jgi:hypothetical protein
VVDTLWDCLAEGGDDLGSSTGAVMDLLGELPRLDNADDRRHDLPPIRHVSHE